MVIKYGKQLTYPGMVFVLFGNARKRVTICFHNFIRGNSRWARYIYNIDDCDGDMMMIIIIIIIIIDTNIPHKTKIILKFSYRKCFLVKKIS
jgi:hypothetical protein